ncbi:hypothetical protein MTBPR1_140047 [Candidatus Terasakiella magnetica]|uniref:Uncharacterized protein n=1 Tax=Candidatus Terasakiella magnetica TaxID=1867952 RepID=A0A1C3RF88_9PROT|nr:hypothetical protein MTBPR1_140047 [Candidatus Terasakiella magnetica]
MRQQSSIANGLVLSGMMTIREIFKQIASMYLSVPKENIWVEKLLLGSRHLEELGSIDLIMKFLDMIQSMGLLMGNR